MRWVGHVESTGERRGVYSVWMGIPEGKWPFGRPTRRWEDNIKIDFQEVRWWGIDLIDISQSRNRWSALVNAVMNLHVP
jgi:hypothetical protein